MESFAKPKLNPGARPSREPRRGEGRTSSRWSFCPREDPSIDLALVLDRSGEHGLREAQEAKAAALAPF